ncbi:alpha/beta hydrolase [Phenylobacterium koreense]|uniref:Dienelactone hydrolase n=1 Tax=Phenylobacterium koreense TaxID=266125 RepID=A0ABV2EJ10_9CAUL
MFLKPLALNSLAAFALAALAPSVTQAATPSLACHIGAYRLSDGVPVVISSSGEDALRYRFLDGRSGRLFPAADGSFESGPGWSSRTPVQLRVRFGDCKAGTIRLDAREGHRIVQPVTPIRFHSGTEELYGELHLPEGGKPKAIVVLQYGSGRESAVANNFVQHLLPLKGIGVFVFDKRGTGRSTGGYTADFKVLAADMSAALQAIRARPEAARTPIGLMGESQGGWVAPLAAELSPVDFVVVSYGLAIAPSEEDHQEMLQVLKANGFGPDAVAKAEAIQKVTSQVFDSGFVHGLDELERLKALYGGEPWFKAGLGGDYTGPLTATPADQLGPVREALNFAIDLNYDPAPTLRATGDTPSLWVLAGLDTEAPSATSLEILRRLQAEGALIDIAVFPNADHGIIEVADPKSGDLAGTHAPGYFDLLSDWIVHRRLDQPFGEAVNYPRTSRR